MSLSPPFEPVETIEKAKAGDKDALSRVWLFLNPGLVRYLSSLGCKNSEDLASESWISLAKVLPKFQGDISALQGLLFQIARARLYDQWRKTYRSPKAGLRLIDRSARIVEISEMVESALDMSSSKAIEWLSQIPKSQAEVISLRVIVGLTYYEISQVIGKSEGAVRILFFRGINNLEKVVTENNLGLERISPLLRNKRQG